MNKNKFIRPAISIMSFIALSAVNYTIVHNPIVLLFSFVLLVHELGHYLMAKYFQLDAKLPIFIPFILFSVGITQIYNLPDEYKSAIAIAGPLLASLVISILILFNIIYKLFSTKLLFLLLTTEIIFNYLGSDGKKYRKFKQQKLSTLFSL